MKSETMYRMDAMRAAGLKPDMTVTNDTATIQGGKMVLIPSPRWRELYTTNLAVRLAYDQDKYGTGGPPPTITRPPEPEPLKPVPTTIIEGEFKKEPERKQEPMSRELLIKTARGHASTFGTKDAYFAWLLTELADALENLGE